MQRKNQLLILAVLLVFSLLTAIRHLSSQGADLSSSYCACKLVATHQADHLYSRDPANFVRVGDPAWTRLVRSSGFITEKQLHPFVQAPLWAYALQPLCTRVSFPAFNNVFLFLISFCLSATIWLIARSWAPRVFYPGRIAAVCAALYLTEAYKYAMLLTQTHIIFVLLTIAALVCARRNHYLWAGALLAAAAAVKVTPAFLLLYWLMTRQWRASLSFVCFSAFFAVTSVLATGWALNLAYLRNLSEISNMLLVSWNNQSLAGLWMAGHYPVAELQAWHSFHLPAVVKVTSTLLSIASTLFGGFLDWRSGALTPGGRLLARPYGAAFAMLGATMFAPVAWTHYYILLLFPLLLMLDATLQKRSLLIAATILVVFALNFDMHTLGGVLLRLELFPVVRAQFYSGLVCMAGLILASLRERSSEQRDLDRNPDRSPDRHSALPIPA